MTHGQIALLLFVPLSLLIFSRQPAHKAVACVFLLGAMFLPVRDNFNPPLLPPLDKNNMTVLAAFAGCLMAAKNRLSEAAPGRGADVWILVMLAGGVATAFTNGDVVRGEVLLPAMGVRDAISIPIRDAIIYALPFFMGRALFRSRAALEDLLRMLTIAGLFYALLAMVEMRLSPQFHRWIYGYHANNFWTAHRLGGFRPMLFMDSGIALGDFMLMTVLAAFTLRRARARLFRVLQPVLGSVTRFVPAFLLLILIGCRSLGAMIYGLAAAPLVARLAPRRLATIALVLGSFTLLYPPLRFLNLFPTDAIVSISSALSPARADSLQSRFATEEHLMDRDAERAWFGWGGFNRDRLDEDTGRVILGIDGFWIITLGQRGIVGVTAAFALLLVPILAAWRRIRRDDDPTLSIMLAGLALIVSLRAVDLLPNGFYGSLIFLLSGALYGCARSPAIAALPVAPPPAPVLEPAPQPPRPGRLADLLRKEGP